MTYLIRDVLSICNRMTNTTGSTCGSRSAYPSRVPYDKICVGFVLLNLIKISMSCSVRLSVVFFYYHGVARLLFSTLKNMHFALIDACCLFVILCIGFMYMCVAYSVKSAYNLSFFCLKISTWFRVLIKSCLPCIFDHILPDSE